MSHIKKHIVDTFSVAERWLLLLSAGLCIVFTFAVPPFQKPDEPAHFLKAVSISQGRLFCRKDSSQLFINPVPAYLVNLPGQFLTMHVASGKEVVFPYQQYKSILLQKQKNTTYINEPNSCSLPSLLYLHIGAALALPIYLQANPIFIFYLGRLVNLLIAGGICYWAVVLTPKNLRKIPLFILTLPIVAQQLSSYSKDALHIAFGLLSFAYLLHFLKKHSKVELHQIIIFFFSLLLTIVARPQYAPFALLALLIPHHKKLKLSLKTRLWAVGFIVSTITIVGVAFTLNIYSADAASLGNTSPNSYVYPDLQIQYLSNPPWKFVDVLYQTFKDNLDGYLKGAVGTLGWLEYTIPWFLFPLYVAFFWFTFYSTKDSWIPINKWQFLIIFLAVFGSLIGVTLAMYLYATPVGAKSIIALQGRYFLLLMPFSLWLLSYLWQRTKFILPVIAVSLIFLSISWGIINRYYNPSHHYMKNDIVQKNYPAYFSLENEIIQKISVSKSKKLVGFSWVKQKNILPITKPYLFSVWDGSCQKMVSEQILPAQNLEDQTYFEVTFPLINLQNSEELCVKLKPYGIAVSSEEALLIGSEQLENPVPDIQPLYVFN